MELFEDRRELRYLVGAYGTWRGDGRESMEKPARKAFEQHIKRQLSLMWSSEMSPLGASPEGRLFGIAGAVANPRPPIGPTNDSG